MAQHTGWLKKLGGALKRQQQYRFFELWGPYLYYYKKAGGVVGCMDMKDSNVYEDPKNPLAFILSGPGLHKNYQLTAKSAEEKAKWVEALRHSTKVSAQDLLRSRDVLSCDGKGIGERCPKAGTSDFASLPGRALCSRARRYEYIFTV